MADKRAMKVYSYGGYSKPQSGRGGDDDLSKPQSGRGGRDDLTKPQSGRGGSTWMELRKMYGPNGYAVGHYCPCCNLPMPLTDWHGDPNMADESMYNGAYARGFSKPQSGRGGFDDDFSKPQSGRGGSDDLSKPQSGRGGIGIYQDDHGWYVGRRCPNCDKPTRLSGYYSSRPDLETALSMDEMSVIDPVRGHSPSQS